MKVRAVITGTTGMVGEGVLHECLHHPDVEKILIINRKPSGHSHPKLEEVIHSDFHNLSAIENKLRGYNACFFCLGVSSVGMKEPEYKKNTYDLTMHVAKTLLKQNSDLTFCYVSGAGTDSTESKGMWARVKGKTENDLLKLPFKNAFMFRPGLIQPTPGLKNTLKFYNYLGWLIPVIKAFSANGVTSLKEIGIAMINTVTKGYEKHVLEVPDIKALAKR
jgi:hypothetical protein